MLKPIEADALAGLPRIRHGFFTREGGVSEGLYAGLNVGFGSGDDRDAVAENRRRVSAHLGFADAPPITLHQVHSADAIHVTGPLAGALPRADGLVTSTPGVVIGALAADCAPVLFADGEAGVVGAAHAGWRGALSGVLEATVAAMTKIGAEPSRIAAAVGPTINQPSYEVGPEFEEAFLARDPGSSRFFRLNQPGGRPHFDLPGFVAARLIAAGLASVERVSQCTYKNESRFYSYRRSMHRNEHDYGRQISAIVVL